MFSRLLNFVLVSLAASAVLALPSELAERDYRLETRDAAFCCTKLAESLPDLVSMPGSTSFVTQQKEYFTRQQQSLTPSCRVSPLTSSDVSAVVRLALEHDCQFAVRAGGHGHTTGESNVDRTGFTIDLTGLNAMTIGEDREVAGVGSGALWVDFYKYLADYGRVATGGRMPSVGTGGYLLGGGISFLAQENGFGSTQVKNYEIVLSDGSIVNANQTSNEDLYWALKMGNTNFGIVTRFDVQTTPLEQMWGGGIIYNSTDHLQDMLSWLKAFAAKADQDNKGHSVVTAVSRNTGPLIWHLNAYSAPVEYPSPVFDGVKFANISENTMRVSDLVDITSTVEAANPVGKRTRYLTFTFKPDAEFGADVFAKARETLDKFLTRNGMEWSTSYQPISKVMITAAQANGGNPTGLTPDDGDLFLSLYTLLWEDEADDAELIAASDELLAWTVQTAKERGVHHPFLYMDYAEGSQAVYESFGTENVRKLKEIQAKYDKGLKFSGLWRGGFDL